MPKIVKSGVGMMEHARLQYDFVGDNPDEDIKGFKKYAMTSIIGFDERRERIAAGFRAVLHETGDLDLTSVLVLHETYNRYAEDALEHLVAKWLIEYHHMNMERAEIASSSNPKNLDYLVERSVELGRLQERIYWRQGIDPATGKNRETLGLAGKRQVKNGQQGNAMRTDNSFGVRHSLHAQDFVADLSKRNPHLTWADLQRAAAKEFNVSVSTIRRELTNPKKVGSSRSE
ncbi:hypothetical protein [Sulfitobacter pontiacus]|uniref:hypothetical protein n=1 Tax=Sulfitobacter pontiacus TaxID=60137 RepID=UPI00315A7678